MDEAGTITLSIFLAIVGLAVQFWIIVYAVRRGMQDHTIWRHTKWPEMKKQIDEGRLDHDGLPVP